MYGKSLNHIFEFVSYMEHYNFFRQFHDISIEEYQLFRNYFKARSFKKGEHIIVPGQVQKELFLVKSGVQMSYFDSGDKIFTLGFTYFPALCAIAESFSFQLPSKYYLTCLTDSELEYITFDDLLKVINQSQQIERLFRRITESMFASMIDLHIDLRALTIQERYKKFCKNNLHLLQIVPHKYISSYLGIDPTNFSKLFNNVQF